MNLEISLKHVNQLMSRFVTEIKGEASMGRTDLNKAAETILIPLLNEIYGWNLVNVNYAEDDNNYPGIDLADKAAKISIQVTATTSSEKVKHTLRQFVKYEQYLEYDRLIIFFLKERQIYKSKTTQTFQDIVQGKIDFDDDKDIWDWHNLLKEVASFQIDRVNRIREILEDNFGGDRQPKLKQETNWRETCQVLLEQWKGLTTNALTTTPDRVSFQIDDVFVPLGVVERKQKPRHAHSDGSPEQGSELYDEKVTPISQNDFFENVLRQGQSQYSQGRRIAIIGEPGAGKTTHLQKIGDWILKETDDIPIWIPLSAIGTKGLREYLSQVWLQAAIPELEVTEHHRDDLGQLLKTGKVWLLLDGADEMTVSDALHHIATQMREGWLRNIRVVLTCRLNVWEAGKNALDNFDVYRNLDFEYPDEVHQFIDKWFREKPDSQQKLKTALEQPGKERIRDMVKNPLRLTLLCYSWQILQGELPETKAGLYQWFVDAFYEWNRGKVPCKLTSTKRKELNHALGELARESIDQNSSRFRLREKFVTHFLGDADDEDSQFHLALQLGWLNRVGVATENIFEGVYSFLHPTFQEYFAALAIDDWDYFLPRKHEKYPVANDQGEINYRIFKPEWKEVVVLWIGILIATRNPFHHREFFEKLLEFNDGVEGLFYFRANFVLGELITEFSDDGICDLIAERLTQWTFGYSDSCSPSRKIKPIRSFSESAITILAKAPYCAKIKAIKNHFSQDVSLSSLDQDEGLALVYILEKSQNLGKEGSDILIMLSKSNLFLVSSRASHALESQGLDHEEKSSSANEKSSSDDSSQATVEINFPNELDQATKELLSEMKDLARLSDELAKIDDIDYLKNYLVASGQRYIRMRVIFRLSEILKRRPDTIESIINLIEETRDEEVFELVAWLLRDNSSNNMSVVKALIRIFRLSSRILALKEVVDSLKFVYQEPLLKEVVFGVKEFLSEEARGDFPQKYSFDFDLIWHCSQYMSYLNFYRAWNAFGLNSESVLK
jgi:hypothetical protein